MRNRYGIILAVILFVICFLCIEGWGADWRQYEPGDYYDAASLVLQKDGSVKVWSKWVMEKQTKSFDEVRAKWTEIYNKKGADEAEWFLTVNVTKEFFNLTEMNCRNRTFRNLAHGERDRDGRTVYGHFQNMKVDTEEIIHIEPNASAELFYQAICK